MNNIGDDVFKSVRIILGVPVNCTAKWGNTHYKTEVETDANNFLLEFTKEENPGEDFIKDAIIGCVTGAGVCDNFGALSSLYLLFYKAKYVFSVKTDNHNFAAYQNGDKCLLVDPWSYKNYTADHEYTHGERKQLDHNMITTFNNNFNTIFEHYKIKFANVEKSGKFINYVKSDEFNDRKCIKSPFVKKS
jgi:hypothetical protein